MKKKTVLESLKDFLQNVQNIFSIPNEAPPPSLPLLLPPILGGSSAASPLKIWDVTLFEQKTEI